MDWMRLFWGVIALGLLELRKFVMALLFVTSIAGMGASVIYFLNEFVSHSKRHSRSFTVTKNKQAILIEITNRP
jgi:hypothetical protein